MVLKFALLIFIYIGIAKAQERRIKINDYQFDESMDEKLRTFTQRRAERYLTQKIDSKEDLTRRLSNDLTREFGQKINVFARDANTRAFGDPYILWDMIITLRFRDAIDDWWFGQG